MRKSLTYKILAAVMAAGSLGLYVAAPAAADDYTVKKDGEIISSGTFTNVYGNGHSFTITGGKIINVYGVGNDNYDEAASGGNVTISGDATVSGNDFLRIANVYGGYTTNGNAEYNTVNISDGVTISGSSGIASVYGGYSENGNVEYNTVNISDKAIVRGRVYGGYTIDGNAEYNTINISSGTIGGGSTNVISGAHTIDGNAEYNIVNISGGTIGTSDRSALVYGGYSQSGSANNNIVNISGGTVTGNICGGYVYDHGTANENNIIISGSADITNANLFGYGGYGTNATGNTLIIDGWSGSTQLVNSFNDINFNNVKWQNGKTVLTITAGYTDDLTNTKINLNSIAGGSNIKVGESMTLIDSNIDLTNEVIGETNKNFTAGVAHEGLGSTSVDINTGKVSFKVNSIKLSSQAVSAAQTRAASAAFVNQGTDLISDSLDTISRDDNYGVKTFAAVHGNRNKYDVADDIKINGWSTIVGVGNADKFDNGSEFSWGVFYENGSGNYRTYNSFNNEFFRGDGSMVYNGGGIAARYENKNGVYTEGSLRAGMLKNELDNAMRDVNGSYGYETESAYYGAHIGVGKIISLSDSSDLDIYGKFFHTYTEGDSVTIAGDKFNFDSITSDRLRVGARITSNKENKFSTYYGLAYEYEFNGDADMTAQGLRADTQSLQGSSVMAEVGFNYQPTPDSPWSFDLNMRGYTGERQGGSFNVQATYTF